MPQPKPRSNIITKLAPYKGFYSVRKEEVHTQQSSAGSLQGKGKKKKQGITRILSAK